MRPLRRVDLWVRITPETRNSLVLVPRLCHFPIPTISTNRVTVSDDPTLEAPVQLTRRYPRVECAWHGSPRAGRRWSAAILGAALLFVACKPAPPTPSSGAGVGGNLDLTDQAASHNIGRDSDTVETGFVALVGTSTSDPLWPVYHATAGRYATSFTDLSIRAAAPQIRSPNAQSTLVRALLAAGMRGLCIEPVDDLHLAPLLDSLTASGIVVVTLRRRTATREDLMHVGADPEDVGAMLAEIAVRAVRTGARARRALSGDPGPGTGTVTTSSDTTPAIGTLGITHADSIDGLSRKRHEAMNRYLKRHPRVVTVLDLDCHAQPDEARVQIRDGLERYPRTDAWVVVGHWPLTDLPHDERLLTSTCRLVAVDALPNQWPRIASGELVASVALDYEKMVTKALRMCLSACRGDVVRADTYFVAPERITADNLAQWQQRWTRWSSPVDAPQ